MPDDVEPTNRGDLLRRIRDELSAPRVGRVVTVYPHTGNEQRPSNHEVDVAVPPGGEVDQQHRRVTVLQLGGDTAVVPKKDQMALVLYREGDDPVAVPGLYGDADADRAPKGNPGDVRITRGQLYTEIAGDGSVARIAKKPDDLQQPTAKVEIDDTGAVTIETDGDITVSAGGDVLIDENGSATAVARQNHTHPYSWTDAAGSGDTGKPNESGTNTQIE